MSAQTTLERAFDLAKSGRCRSMDEVRARLKAEGYDVQALQGKVLLSQLRALIKEAEHLRAQAIAGDSHDSK